MSAAIGEITRIYFKTTQDDIDEFICLLRKNFPDYVEDEIRLVKIIKSFKSSELTVYIENNYVDRQYRDSYYIYYSQKFENIKRNCIRLVFFENNINRMDFINSELDEKLEDSLIGYIVLRPLHTGNIGHTLLNPKKISISGYYRTGKFKLMLLGHKFSFEAFPFSTQDGETMTCAETTLYNLMEYYGGKYSDYKTIMPSEILNNVEENSWERVLPSKGVSFENITKVLYNMGFYPRIYYSDILPEQTTPITIQHLLHYYVESGIPIAVGLEQQKPENTDKSVCDYHLAYHSIVCFGHGKLKPNALMAPKPLPVENDEPQLYFVDTATAYSDYITMDDQLIPFGTVDFDSSPWEIKCISVPLYRRIFMDAADARAIVLDLLTEGGITQKIREAYADDTWGTEDNPFIFRMFLTTSRSYKLFKNKNTTGEIQYRFGEQNFPKFIWVAELSSRNHYFNNEALAEIVLDATSSFHGANKGILSIGYNKHYHFYTKDKQSTQKKDLTDFFIKLYNSYYNSYVSPFEMFRGINLKEG